MCEHSLVLRNLEIFNMQRWRARRHTTDACALTAIKYIPVNCDTPSPLQKKIQFEGLMSLLVCCPDMGFVSLITNDGVGGTRKIAEQCSFLWMFVRCLRNDFPRLLTADLY